MEQSLVSIKRRSFDFRLNRRTSTRARHWSGRLPDARPDGQRTKVRGRETKTRSVFIHWHRPSSAVCFVSTELVPSAEYCPPPPPPSSTLALPWPLWYLGAWRMQSQHPVPQQQLVSPSSSSSSNGIQSYPSAFNRESQSTFDPTGGHSPPGFRGHPRPEHLCQVS